MTEPTDAEIIALADETRTAEGGANGYILPISFARAVLAKWRTPQPTKAQAVNQADRPFIVRLAEDFGEDCVTAGYVTTKAASYGRLMDEALSAQAQAGAVPLTDEHIRAMCKESWVFETVKQWVRITEQHHGITGGKHGTE